MFVDSHCHLEMESFDSDREFVVESALKENISYILTVGTERNYFEKVIQIIDRHSFIFGALGIHPHNAPEFDMDVAERMRSYAKHPKILACGEIGLDFFKDYSPREIQIRSFHEQLELAQELHLPIIVHSRHAPSETLEILTDTYTNGRGGVIHCYSYDLDYAKRFLDLGMYISIPGTITYKNTEKLKKVVEYIPDDRLLTETDAPFLTPEPHRGIRNVPQFVKHTIEKIASIRNREIEDLAMIIRDNFTRLFLTNKEELS